jgi:hypothetical protein
VDRGTDQHRAAIRLRTSKLSCTGGTSLSYWLVGSASYSSGHQLSLANHTILRLRRRPMAVRVHRHHRDGPVDQRERRRDGDRDQPQHPHESASSAPCRGRRDSAGHGDRHADGDDAPATCSPSAAPIERRQVACVS